ncbi:MAG: hypothetical protein CMQ12_10325 [Gammaproteobacteria bacterium]|nr:hypothetical protein [Gammaproteobacteria bacterium]
MIRKLNIATIAIIMVLVVGGTSYIYTAPYAGNAGLSRMPGVRIGGTLTAAPEDFSSLNDVRTNLIMKLDGCQGTYSLAYRLYSLTRNTF